MATDSAAIKADIDDLVERTIAGVMQKFPDVEAIREAAWEEGRQAGRIECLEGEQLWVRARLSARTKYEDTRALEEVLSRVQDEIRRIQDGTIGDTTPAG